MCENVYYSASNRIIRVLTDLGNIFKILEKSENIKCEFRAFLNFFFLTLILLKQAFLMYYALES